MFKNFFEKYSKNPTVKKDGQVLSKLIKEGNTYLDNLKEIDQEIAAVQRSTKTTFSLFTPVHNYCRTKYQWYYNWHLKPYASKVNFSALLIILLASSMIGFYPLLSSPKSAKAATTTCTWTNGGGDNLWSNASNWGCGNVPTNSNDVILDGTSTANLTIDAVATAASFSMNSGYAGTVTANQNLTLDTTSSGTGNFTIAAGTYVANTTTITVPGSWNVVANSFSYGTSTVNLTGTGSAFGNFYNLTAAAAGKTTTFNSANHEIAGVLTLGTGILTGGYDNILSATSGTPLVNGGATINSRLTFSPGPGNTINLPGGNYSMLTLCKGAGTINLAGDIVASSIDIGYAVWGTSTVNTTSNNYSITATGNMRVGLNANVRGNLITNNSTVTVGGNLTIATGSEVNTTTASSSIFNVAGNWTNSGTFTASSSTVNFTKSSGTQTLDSGASSFYNLTHSGAGTLQLVTNDLDVNGNFSQTAGIFDAGTNVKNQNYAGNFSLSNGTTYTKGGTLTFDGTAAATITDNNTTKQDLGTVVINKTDTTNPNTNNKVTLGSSIEVDSISVDGTLLSQDTLDLGSFGSNTLTVNGGATTIGADAIITGTNTLRLLDGSGALLGTGGTLSSAVRFETLSTDAVVPARTYGSTVTIYNGTSTNRTATLGTTVSQTINFNNLTLLTGSTGKLTVTAATYNPIVNISGNYTGAWSSSNGAKNLNMGNGTWTVGGNWNSSSAGNLTSNNSTIIFTGSGASIVTNEHFKNTIIRNNVSFSGSYYDNGASSTFVVDPGYTLTVNDKIDMTSTSTSVTLNGNITGTGTFQVGNGSLLTGDGTISVASFNFAKNGGTNYIPARTYNSNVAVKQWVSDSPNVLAIFGTAADQTITINGNFTLETGRTSTSTADASVYNPNVIISGNISASGSGTGTRSLVLGSGTFSVGGDINFTDIAVTPGTSTVNFTKSSGTQTLTSANQSFYNLTHSGAGTLQLATNALNVNGSLTNSAGIFDANGLNVSVAKDWNISGGSFSAGTTPGSQTVTFDSADTTTVSGSNTFNNLTLKSDSSSSGRTIKFAAGTTQTIGGNWTFDGNSEKVLSLRSTQDDSPWYFNISAPTTSGSYIDVKDSYSANSNKITPANYTNVTNSGNNDGWIFNQAPNSPTLSEPLESAWLNDNTPTFNFSLSDPDNPDKSQQLKYQIQISDQSNFSNIITDYTSALANEGDFSFTLGQAAGSGAYNDSHGNEGQTLTPGEYYWQIKTYDDRGSSSEYVGRHFTIDMSVPSISFAANPVSPDGANDWYKTTAPVITITASSLSSPVSNIYYKWDNASEFTLYSEPITSNEGIHILYAYATNEAGNSGENSPTHIEYKVDTINPNVDIYVDPASPNGNSGWYKSAVPKITFTAYDQTSGAGDIYYYFDNNSENPIEYPGRENDGGTISIPEGNHTVYYYNTDLAGNQTQTFSRDFKVDATLPTLESNISSNPNTDIGWYKDIYPTIALSSTDLNSDSSAGSGVANIYYKWDNTEDYSSYSDTSITSNNLSDGIHTLYYYGEDIAGNKNSTQSKTIKLDSGNPSVSDVTPAATSPTNKLDVAFVWNNDNTLINNADGSGSGIDYYLVTIGSTSGGDDIIKDQKTSSSTPTFTQTFSTVGTYYIKVKAVDNVGHISSDYSKEGSVLIDQTNPILTVDNLTDNLYIKDKTFTIKGSTSDEIPGVAKVQLQFNNGDWKDASLDSNKDGAASSWSYSWEDYADGSYTVVAKATDKAGNEITSTKFELIVDSTAPTIPGDFRTFNVSNSSAKVYVAYLDFAGSNDDTSGIKKYEIYRDKEKIADINVVKDSSSSNYTGNANQPYYFVDQDLSAKSYDYQIKATDNAGNVSETPTVPVDTTGKTIEQDKISELKGNPSSVVGKDETSAVVSWKTVYPATSLVEYGQTTSYGNKTTLDESLNQGHSILINDLKPGTTYHAKVVSKDIYGRETVSEDITFTTNSEQESKTALQLIVEALQSLFKTLIAQGADSTNSASTTENNGLESLQEYSNNLLLTDVSFAAKGLYQNILTFPKNSAIAKSNNSEIYSALNTNSNAYYLDKNLTSGLIYNYKLDDGVAISRKPSVGDDSLLTIANPQVIKESVSVSRDKVQLSVNWNTNKGATSFVEFGTSTNYGQKTKEDAALNMGHTVILEGLLPNATYHFKVTSTDENGSTVQSKDFTYQTPILEKEKSPLDIIFETLQRVFSKVSVIF